MFIYVKIALWYIYNSVTVTFVNFDLKPEPYKGANSPRQSCTSASWPTSTFNHLA